MVNAFAYTAQKGIETEADYPYKAQDRTCQYDAKKAVKVNKAFKNVAANNVDALKAALAVQPVAVAIEADYPYHAVDQKCKYVASKAHKVNTGFKVVPANNVDALKAAIAVQPVSVSIEADEDSFQFYSSGVIKSGCGADLDHGVLAVGYTTVNGEEAFIVKNSWNSSWGDKGYIMLSTDKKANNGAGVCGILAMASVPTA